MASKLAGKWKAVQGEEKWKGLLDPLDEDLCKELIRYGQFVQTVYDSYNHSALSAALGYSRYGKSEFFEKLHVRVGYTIHKYIYCTVLLESLLGKVVQGVADLAGGFTGNVTSWFGYVAVSDDEETKRLGRRDIVIVFRGTQEDLEWANNLLNTFKGSTQPNIEPMSGLPPLDPDKASDTPVNTTTTTTTTKTTGFGLVGGVLSTVKEVTVGVVQLLPWQKALIGNRWLIPYTATNEAGNGFGKKSARIQIIEAISELIELYKDEELSITVTGHSLGAAIATVCAYDIANEKKNVNPVTGKTIPVTAFTFASPRVGNLEFREVVSKMPGLAMLRIASITDIVPQVPPLLLYIHAGEDFLLMTSHSGYLTFPNLNLSDAHNLQVYLHLIANKYDPNKVDQYHPLELVNKGTNALKSPIVPGSWWVVENNDVIFDAQTGKWMLRTYNNISIDNKEFN